MNAYAKIISLIFILNLVGIAQVTGAWNYKSNRIAISADGNNQYDSGHIWPRADPDDWGATPTELAIIAKLNLFDQLVHFSYNNFIDSPPHTTDINQMDIGIKGAIQYWNYDPNKFYDVSEDLNAAKAHLKAQIEKSTAADPLYFIHAGPAEFFYQVVQDVVNAGNASSLDHVYIVSHSGYNDTHLRRDTHHTMPEAITLSGNRLNYKKIKDQNGASDPNVLWKSGDNWAVWSWMKNHSDESVNFIYERMQAHTGGVADISDAGMVFWLTTGDEDGSPSKFKTFIGDGVPAKSTTTPSSSSEIESSSSSVIEPSSSSEDEPIYMNPDSNDIIIIEAENFNLKGNWNVYEDSRAFGDKYISYDGPNRYNAAIEAEEISYTFTAHEAGTYTVKWLMRQPDEVAGDLANDVWIYFPEDLGYAKNTVLTDFEKYYGRSKTDFGYNGIVETTELGHNWMNVKIPAAGEYEIKLSGRSQFLQIDRIVMYKNMTFDESEVLAKTENIVSPGDGDITKNINFTSSLNAYIINNNSLIINHNRDYTEIKIYSITGKVMLTKYLNKEQNSIQLNSLKNGTYILKSGSTNIIFNLIR